MIFTSFIDGNRTVARFLRTEREELCELRQDEFERFWSGTCALNVKSQPVDYPPLRFDLCISICFWCFLYSGEIKATIFIEVPF